MRPINKLSNDTQKNLGEVIDNLQQAFCCIECYTGDNPKRALGKNCLQFSALYPCEYCFQKGTQFVIRDKTIQKQTEDNQTKKKLITDKLKNLKKDQSKNENEINVLNRLLKSANEEDKKKSLVEERKLYGLLLQEKANQEQSIK